MLNDQRYNYIDAELNDSHSYLLPAVGRILHGIPGERRLFDLGCGNGSVAAHFTRLGYDVTGIDASVEGIAQAQAKFPHAKLFQASVYDDLAGRFGQFPLVLSLEVAEHVFDPHTYAERLFDLVAPGGHAILSTPYHGYIKNLALAVTGQMDAHFTALWRVGHIKFWSPKTLRTLLCDAGFAWKHLERVGRIPPLAKSMIAIVQRPA